MTTPQERTRAVNQVGIAIVDLSQYAIGRSVTARVPREKLRHLYQWLRHYPTPSELSMTAEAAPHLWHKEQT